MLSGQSARRVSFIWYVYQGATYARIAQENRARFRGTQSVRNTELRH